MKRIIAILLTGLIVVPVVTLGPNNRVARADVLRYKSVALDSLPLVDSESTRAYILTLQDPGHYRGDSVNSGVQLRPGCGVGLPKATFRLHGAYDELSGTIYNEDPNNVPFMIYDSSDPSNKRVLYNTTVKALDQPHFRVSVRGVDYLSLFENLDCGNSSLLDIVATLSVGSPSPTTVVSRYPAANAGVPANSKVLVGWNAFPGATNYLFHVWVVNTDASATITSKTPLAFSATVYHNTKYPWDDTGFPTGTYQYALLPLDAKGKALAGWSAPTQITIAS